MGACPFSFLQNSRCPTLFERCPFWLLVYYSVFFAGWGSVCPGGYAGLSQGWLWEYHVLFICSPVVLHLPSRLGASVWWRRSLPGFFVYHGVWKLCVGWVFLCVRVLPFLGGFPARCVSSISARFLLYGAHTICFLLLVTILEPPVTVLR
jgi:hypothetical protein